MILKEFGHLGAQMISKTIETVFGNFMNDPEFIGMIRKIRIIGQYDLDDLDKKKKEEDLSGTK